MHPPVDRKLRPGSHWVLQEGGGRVVVAQHREQKKAATVHQGAEVWPAPCPVEITLAEIWPWCSHLKICITFI